MITLTPVEMRTATSGIDLRAMEDEELIAYIQQAESLAAAYMNADSLHYRTCQDIKDWNAENLRFNLMQRPLRTVLIYTIVVGTYAGQDYAFNIDNTPVAATGSPSILPTSVGNMKINRTINGGDASAFLGVVGIGAVVGSTMDPEQQIDYTAGWDDGTVQGDGYTLPYPQWLKDAVRFITVDLLGDWETGRMGMTGLQQMRSADAVFRKPTSRSQNEVVIPLKAKKLIDRHYQPWMTGG